MLLSEKHFARGFTLIELSIVLVIIGLIVGGVLVGRDLIKAAQARGQISQIEQYTTATNTFRLKYNCLPGDCINAVSLGLGNSAGPGRNGNGDGAITTVNTSFNDSLGSGFNRETLDFWYHLSQAGLLDGNYEGYSGQTWAGAAGEPAQIATTPQAKGGNNARVMVSNLGYTGYANSRTAGNSFYLYQPGTAHETRRTGIKPSTARMIDMKLDDGVPKSGIIGCTYLSVPYLGIAAVGASCGYNIARCDSGVAAANAYSNSDDGECGTVFLNRF